MAHFLTPFMKTTTRQCDYIVNARNRLGAHAYYTGGFNANKEQFRLYLPSTFSKRFSFTLVFQYDGNDRDIGSLFLAHETKLTQTFLELKFSNTYNVQYYHNNQQQSVDLFNIKTPVKGFHVLQFESVAHRLWVHIDGELLFPTENAFSELDSMRVFHTGGVGNSPFVMWESHFTAIENLVLFEPTFGFKHDNLSIRKGGYAFIQAEWREDIEIAMKIKVGISFFERTIRSIGDTALLLKLYKSGFAFGYANTNSGAVLDDSLRHIALDEFHIEPMPTKVVDFTIVTGEIP